MNASNPSLDLRVRRTYKFLWDALIGLMTEQDFESVTVTDICERAMVHRTTFYKHYEDKYGLLYHGMQDQLNALFEDVDAQLDPSVQVMDEAAILPHLVVLFEHILRHERFYRLMLCGDGIGKFYRMFGKSLVERYMRLSYGHFSEAEGSDAMRNALRAQSHVGALLSTVTWWLENNCPYPPKEMAQYLWEDAFSLTGRRWHRQH
jgi:AcrR family transcriptional regulator